jgi:hypothetical protein
LTAYGESKSRAVRPSSGLRRMTHTQDLYGLLMFEEADASRMLMLGCATDARQIIPTRIRCRAGYSEKG